MKYKLIKNISELEGTCYFEFLPGKYRDKCWNEESVYLTEDSISFFEDLLKKTNIDFDHYSFQEYNFDQIQNLLNELGILLERLPDSNFKIQGNLFSPKYYNELNTEVKLHRLEIIQMIRDVQKWLEETSNNHSVISILGI